MAESEIIAFEGIEYRRWPQSKRWSDRVYYRGKNGKRLHVALWEHAHGPVPSGCVIHHIDRNPSNNRIENLECVGGKRHGELHPYTYERLEQAKTHLDAVRDGTKEWHASPEGREWHRQHGVEAYRKREPVERTCEHCGKRSLDWNRSGKSRFCGNNCKSAARRAEGTDLEGRVCAICGKTFMVNKYWKNATCSRPCGQRLRAGRVKAGV